MGRPKTFTILLKNNVYFAGSNVEGSVLLELSEPKVLQGISIVLSGKAKVNWSETRGASYIITYSDTELFFDDMTSQLLDTNGTVELAAGKYEYPFKFQLPSDPVLPTSFESPNGYIRYVLTATISRSWKYTTKVAISVNEVVDINTPQLTTAFSSSNEKTTCCLCCASGPISLSVTTDRAGYCPGESIAISTEAENHSNRRITVVRASLKQKASYYAEGNSCSSTKIIQRIEGPGLAARSTSSWSNELLPIPAISPTIGSCRILQLSYYLTVTLVVQGTIDLHVTIPVTIGNVPFRGQSQVAYNSNSYLPPPHPPKSLAAETSSQTPIALNYSATYPPVYIGDDNYMT